MEHYDLLKVKNLCLLHITLKVKIISLFKLFLYHHYCLTHNMLPELSHLSLCVNVSLGFADMLHQLFYSCYYAFIHVLITDVLSQVDQIFIVHVDRSPPVMLYQYPSMRSCWTAD